MYATKLSYSLNLQWIKGHYRVREGCVPAVPIGLSASISSIATIDWVSSSKNHWIRIKNSFATHIIPKVYLLFNISFILEGLIKIDLCERSNTHIFVAVRRTKLLKIVLRVFSPWSCSTPTYFFHWFIKFNGKVFRWLNKNFIILFHCWMRVMRS